MKKPGGILIVRDSVQEGERGMAAVMDEAERAQLDAVLAAGKAELARGEVVPLEQVLSEL